jgi:hypothetical protein
MSDDLPAIAHCAAQITSNCRTAVHYAKRLPRLAE